MMGTNAYIARQQENGNYRTIFCQLDGYPEWVGKMLVENYNTPEKVDALLDVGDIYRLGESLTPDPDIPHNPDEGWQKGVTVAFGRDWGESEVEAQEFTLDELMGDNDPNGFIEFSYVYTEEHGWRFCSLLDYDPEFADVKEALAAEEEPCPDITNEMSFSG